MFSAVSCITTLYSRIFARLYDPIMQGLEQKFLREKRRSLLERTHGSVLEVGAGTGANFHFYPSGANVLAVEPSASMLRYARERLPTEKGQARIKLLEAGVGDGKVAALVPNGGFDFIVCTLVLCTIPEHHKTIRQFREWLKPGGQLLVLEHIKGHRQPQRCLQRAITPAWKYLAEGCHLDRPTDEVLKASGFRAVEEAYFYRWAPFYWGVLECAKA